MKKYIKLIRLKHWLKNGLIFLPLFFNKSLFNKNLLLNAIIAFLIFSFISSIIYIINDLSDIEKDKKHPEKKKRPLASGDISKTKAYIVLIILSILSILTLLYLFIKTKEYLVLVIPISYLILNILYSKGLKDVPIIDVVILVSGFLFRVIYGGVINNIEVSRYLYLMIIFTSFFMGFGKRRNEIIKNGDKGRNVLKYYTKEFLDKNMYVSVSLAIVSYTLWCVDPSIGKNSLFWTIPLVMIIFQIYSLNIEKDSHGDPIEVILSDKKLLAFILLYLIIMFLLLYV